MILTERHHIKPNNPRFNECDMLAYVSKNLYNSSLYVVRQHYLNNNTFVTGTYINKSGNRVNEWVFSSTYLYHQLKDKPEFRTDKHEEYNGLKVNTKVLKQTEQQVSGDISNYLKAMKAYSKQPSKFKGMPKLPTYKKKTGRNVVTFPKDAISWRKLPGYINLGGTNIYIKPYKATIESIKEVKIVPLVYGYDIVISYEVVDITHVTTHVTTHTKYAAIDLGLNNLATLTSNDTSFEPFIVNGRPLKSINQYFNKKKAN